MSGIVIAAVILLPILWILVQYNRLVSLKNEALRQVLVVAERYPDLKAEHGFLELHRELVDTEDRIQAARRFYNGNVRDYRNACETFPSGLIASLFGFQAKEYFTVPSAVREVPQTAFAEP